MPGLGCYAPEPAPAPPRPNLSCAYTKGSTPAGRFYSNAYDAFGDSGPAYGDPISLSFKASGGVGGYQWDVLQTYSEFGSITYADGSKRVYSGGLILDTLSPDEFKPNGNKFTFSDVPNIWSTNVVAAALSIVFSTDTSVGSGDQWVNCPQITWVANFTVTTNKKHRPQFKGRAIITGQ